MSDNFTRKSGAILGLGTALPKFSIEQTDAAQIVTDLGITLRWNRAIPQLYRASGVKRRGSVLLNSESGPAVLRQDFFKPRAKAIEEETSPIIPIEDNLDEAASTPTLDPTNLDRGPSTRDRMLAFESYANGLAIQASERALSNARIAPDQITHLITVSCSGFSAPGIDFALIDSLGLSHSVLRTNVGFMGCHAAINALRVADSIVAASPNSKVLLCAVELCSLHQQYSDDPQQLVANSLFADGAAAIVLGSIDRSLESLTQPTEQPNNLHRWSIVDSASTWIPNTTDMMSWRIGDHGFQMTLSPKVPTIIEERLHAWMCDWLKQHELNIDNIHHWIIHPGGPKILDACGTSLGLSPEALEPSRRCLRENGNMSSPTVLFILESCGPPVTNAFAILLGFGPGLAIEAALLRAV